MKCCKVFQYCSSPACLVSRFLSFHFVLRNDLMTKLESLCFTPYLDTLLSFTHWFNIPLTSTLQQTNIPHLPYGQTQRKNLGIWLYFLFIVLYCDILTANYAFKFIWFEQVQNNLSLTKPARDRLFMK